MSSSAAAAPARMQFRRFLDQIDSGTFELLDLAKIVELRTKHVLRTRDPPPDAARPTNEQLSALSAKIAGGRAPFADFAIFGPAFGTSLGDPGFVPEADFNNDNVINVFDFAVFGPDFGCVP